MWLQLAYKDVFTQTVNPVSCEMEKQIYSLHTDVKCTFEHWTHKQQFEFLITDVSSSKAGKNYNCINLYSSWEDGLKVE